MPRNDDLSLILTKAKKQGFLPDVHDSELEVLEAEYRKLKEGDIHPEPSDLALGESVMPRHSVSSASAAVTSQLMRLMFFTARKTETVSSVNILTGTAGAAATPTLCRIGLYLENADKSLSLVASTVNDTALFNGTFADVTKAFQAPYLKVRGQRYAVGVLVVTAAAVPTFYGCAAVPTPAALKDPKIAGSVAGLADLPSSIASGSIGSSSNSYYVAVTP